MVTLADICYGMTIENVVLIIKPTCLIINTECISICHYIYGLIFNQLIMLDSLVAAELVNWC